MGIKNVQILRAVAALMVVWLHAKEKLPGLNNYFHSGFGAAGVELFFVISGLIMVYSTTRKDISPVDFLLKRCQRIIPLYWLATTVFILVALVTPQLQGSTTLVWEHVISSYFFVPANSPSFPNFMWPVLIPGWTLNYEMAFYLVFALSLFVRQSLRLPLLLVALAGSVLCGLALEPKGALAFYTNDVILTFGLGALIGGVVVANSFQLNGLKAALWLICSALVWMLLPRFEIPSRFLNVGVPAALVVLGFCYLQPIKARATELLVVLGDASYSIYLTHVFTLAILRLMAKALLQAPLTLPESYFVMFVSMAACSVVGYLTYKFVERPIALLWAKS